MTTKMKTKTKTITITRAKLIVLSNLETKHTKQEILKALRDSFCFVSLNVED